MLISVPTDFPTLQAAVDAAGPGVAATVVVEAGHALTGGVTVSGGDYSMVRITSVDAVAQADECFTGPLVQGIYARMPVLACLVDMRHLGDDGYHAYKSSSGHVEAGCGVRNAGSTGLKLDRACRVSAEQSVFTGAAHRNVHCRSSVLSAERATLRSAAGGDRNVYVNRGSSAFLTGADITGAPGVGVVVRSAQVEMAMADVSGAQSHGAEFGQGSTGSFRDGTALNCGGRGLAVSASRVDASRLHAVGNASGDLGVFHGSDLSAGAAVTTHGAPSLQDVNVAAFNVFHGSHGVIWA